MSPTHRPPLPPRNIPGTHFYWILSRNQGHSAARRNMLMKNTNHISENRSRDIPVCSPVPQQPPSPGATLKMPTAKYTNTEGNGVTVNICTCTRKESGLNVAWVPAIWVVFDCSFFSPPPPHQDICWDIISVKP